MIAVGSSFVPRKHALSRSERRKGAAMPKIHAVAEADLKLLRQFDTPTICNVLELFDIRPRIAGYMDKRIQACYPKLPPMVGYASTATFRARRRPHRVTPTPAWSSKWHRSRNCPGRRWSSFRTWTTPSSPPLLAKSCARLTKPSARSAWSQAGRPATWIKSNRWRFPASRTASSAPMGIVIFHRSTCRSTSATSWCIPAIWSTATATASPSSPTISHPRPLRRVPNWPPPRQSCSNYLKSGKIDPKGYGAARNECKNRIDALARKLKGLL